MTSIDTTTAVTTHHHHGPSAQMKAVFSAVEDKLGMSKDELRDALKSGKSLADIASDKGVSKDDLLATVSKALGSSNTDLATSIVDHKGGPRGHHGPPPPRDGGTSATSTGGVAFSLPAPADGQTYV